MQIACGSFEMNSERQCGDAIFLQVALIHGCEGKARRNDTGCCACSYVPNRRLQYEYPDNYKAAVQQSCLDDSNVLDGPESDGEHYLFPHGRSEEEVKAECGRDYH